MGYTNIGNKKSNITPAGLVKHYNKRFELIERNSELFFGNHERTPHQIVPPRAARKQDLRYASLDSKTGDKSIFDQSFSALDTNNKQASFVIQKGQN